MPAFLNLDAKRRKIEKQVNYGVLSVVDTITILTHENIIPIIHATRLPINQTANPMFRLHSAWVVSRWNCARDRDQHCFIEIKLVSALWWTRWRGSSCLVEFAGKTPTFMQIFCGRVREWRRVATSIHQSCFVCYNAKWQVRSISTTIPDKNQPPQELLMPWKIRYLALLVYCTLISVKPSVCLPRNWM